MRWVGIGVMVVVLGLGMLPSSFAQTSGQVITPENVTSLGEVQVLGRGRVQATAWSPDYGASLGRWFAVQTTRGIWLHPASALDAEPRLLATNMEAVTSFAFYPNKAWVMTGHANGTIATWDIETGDLIGATNATPYPIYSLVIAPDASRFAFGEQVVITQEAPAENISQPQAQLWSLTEMTHIATLVDENTSYYNFGNVLFTPDSQAVITNVYALSDGYAGSEVAIWSAANGELVQNNLGVEGYKIQISPDGRYLSGLSFPYFGIAGVRIYDLVNHETLAIPEYIPPDYDEDQFTTFVTTHTFLDNDTLLFYDRLYLYQYDIPSGEYRQLRVYDGSGQYLYRADNGVISVWAGDNFFHYRDVVADDLLGVTTGYTYAMTRVMLSDDNSTIYALEGNLTYDGFRVGSQLVVWDVAAGRIVRIVDDNPYTSMALSPDNSQIALGDQLGQVTIYDLTTDRLETWEVNPQCTIAGVAFHPDGTQLATAEAITNNDCQTQQPIKRWSLLARTSTPIGGTSENVNAIVYSTGGQLYFMMDRAFGYGNGTTVPIDDPTIRGVLEMQNLTISPNGAFLVGGGMIGYHGGSEASDVWVMETANGRLHRLDGHSLLISGVAVSPDNRLIASASIDGSVIIWSAESFAPLHQVRHFGGAYDVAFSADGQWLVTAGNDGTIRLWGVQ